MVMVYGVRLYAIFFLSDIIVIISNFCSLVLMNYNYSYCSFQSN